MPLLWSDNTDLTQSFSAGPRHLGRNPRGSLSLEPAKSGILRAGAVCISSGPARPALTNS